jgi:hypothetical protein
MVVVIVVAACACRFEFVAPPFSLTAVLPVFADGPVQLLLRSLHTVLATIVIAIHRLGRHSANDHEKCGQDHRQHSRFSCHLFLQKNDGHSTSEIARRGFAQNIQKTGLSAPALAVL